MTRITGTAIAALLTTTSLATAGGVERQAQSPAILFEDGNYVEFSYTFTNPDVSGTQLVTATATSLAGSDSGDVAPSFSYTSLSYVHALSDDVSVALIVDSPIGADVDYAPNGGSGYLYGSGAGSQAEIRSRAITAAVRYSLNDNISIYGGLRAVEAEGSVALFNGSGGLGTTSRYQMDAESDYELGYMLGAAYERTDIALRVALTYYSATEHTFDAVETDNTGTFNTEFETTIPQQVLLEAQSGVAEGTLVFGSIRWTEWTEFDITPTIYADNISGGSALVDYDDDVWTYTLGGARRITDELALLGSITYEASQGGFAGNLGPTDGRTSIGLGARYETGPWRLTGGVNYTFVGDATTEAPNPFPDGTSFGDFEDNDAVSFGLRVGYSF
ncbi:outer membrane protein transport protein [Gymnodinialimonas sp. 2305UL16-5]|uniref:OmpP1/FadL family transporter n=1 Tax=Gymnodinialimonas mytili TaxID=3126503 RepID=UPI0030B4A746